MTLELPGIFFAGLLTFLSPCVLPLIPLYLSLLAGVTVAQLREETNGVRHTVKAALAFSAGLTVVFVALGMVASSVGGLLDEYKGPLLQVAGLALFVFGLKQLGVIQVPWLDRESRPLMNRVRLGGSVPAAFLFGAGFALGWSPCIGPALGGVLTYTSSATANPWLGAAYLGSYAAGLTLPLIGVAFAAPTVLRWLDGAKRHLRTFERVGGAVLAVMGVLMVTQSLDALVPSIEPSSGAIGSSATVATATTTASASPESEADGATCEVTSDGAAVCEVPASTSMTSAPAATSPGIALNRPTMVEFVSRTCTACQRMEPLVSALEASCARWGVDVVRLDVGTAEGKKTAAQYGIRGVPTFVFFDGNGLEATRQVGERPLASLQEGLSHIAPGGCAEG